MAEEHTGGIVIAVCRKAEAGLPKLVVDEIELIADQGVAGVYHAGQFVRHRYLARKDPTRINTRQVLLVDAQSYRELAQAGIELGPGMLGENITVAGLPLMQLTAGTQLAIGDALLEITEVRTPCKQLNGIAPHLLSATTIHSQGKKTYRAGMLARVVRGGPLRAGARVTVLP